MSTWIILPDDTELPMLSTRPSGPPDWWSGDPPTAGKVASPARMQKDDFGAGLAYFSSTPTSCPAVGGIYAGTTLTLTSVAAPPTAGQMGALLL